MNDCVRLKELESTKEWSKKNFVSIADFTGFSTFFKTTNKETLAQMSKVNEKCENISDNAIDMKLKLEKKLDAREVEHIAYQVKNLPSIDDMKKF